jgi:hypothetical protein
MTIWKKIKTAWDLSRAWKKARKEADVTKKHLESMTVWGLILMIIATLKAKFGWEVSESQVESVITAVLWLIGVITAYLGRRRAERPLKG